jgi:hypothetical protein
LSELIQHLKAFSSMQDESSNQVFVVSLSRTPVNQGVEYSWIDVVERDRRYFHGVGNGWPITPPNYVAFRHGGQLQSVHHVDEYKVVVDLAEVNPLWPKTNVDQFIYSLGPPMRPARPLPNGKIWPNGRYWCAIDTLLSGAYPTVKDARDESQRRLSEQLT